MYPALCMSKRPAAAEALSQTPTSSMTLAVSTPLRLPGFQCTARLQLFFIRTLETATISWCHSSSSMQSPLKHWLQRRRRHQHRRQRRHQSPPRIQSATHTTFHAMGAGAGTCKGMGTCTRLDLSTTGLCSSPTPRSHTATGRTMSLLRVTGCL